MLPKPDGHPFLRLTRKLEADMVVTIEPGLYFIPTLLCQLRAGPHAAAINWPLVEHLSRFGGVRIEDDVVCRAEGAPENLTRDAFAAASTKFQPSFSPISTAYTAPRSARTD